jgi:hypothetical protein
MQSREIYSSDSARGWIPWGALAPFLALAFVIASLLIGTEIVTPFARFDALGSPLDANALVAFAVGPFGLLLAWLTGGAQGPEASVVCLAYFALAIAFFWLRPRR